MVIASFWPLEGKIPTRNCINKMGLVNHRHTLRVNSQSFCVGMKHPYGLRDFTGSINTFSVRLDTIPVGFCFHNVPISMSLK